MSLVAAAVSAPPASNAFVTFGLLEIKLVLPPMFLALINTVVGLVF
jgi:hypothetical protein